MTPAAAVRRWFALRSLRRDCCGGFLFDVCSWPVGGSCSVFLLGWDRELEGGRRSVLMRHDAGLD